MTESSGTLTDKSSTRVEPHEYRWDELLREHDRWLRTIVYARLGEPQAVDDVMQEVALAAVRQSAQINDPSKVAPWLYRLAVRQSLLYFLNRLPNRLGFADVYFRRRADIDQRLRIARHILDELSQ